MIPILQLNIYMVLFMPPSTQRKTKTVMLSTNSNIESRVLLLITDIYLCLCNLRQNKMHRFIEVLSYYILK